MNADQSGAPSGASVEPHLEIRFDVLEAGSHVHVRVYAGPDEDHRAYCGELAFRVEEWRSIERRLVDLTTDGTISTTIAERRVP